MAASPREHILYLCLIMDHCFQRRLSTPSLLWLWLFCDFSLQICNYPFLAEWQLYVPLVLMLINSVFCVPNEFMCCVWFSAQTTIISTESVYNLIFLIETVFCALETELQMLPYYTDWVLHLVGLWLSRLVARLSTEVRFYVCQCRIFVMKERHSVTIFLRLIPGFTCQYHSTDIPH